jgi:hypothetical protein
MKVTFIDEFNARRKYQLPKEGLNVVMSVTEEFNRQIKDETSRKSFAARLAGIYNWSDVTNAFSPNWIWYSSHR